MADLPPVVAPDRTALDLPGVRATPPRRVSAPAGRKDGGRAVETTGRDAQATVLGLAPVADPARTGPGPAADAVEDQPTIETRAGPTGRRGADPARRKPSSSAQLRAARPAAVAPASASLEPGTMLGGLRLLGRIGAGGMGTVWLARQLSLDRNVAVKILRPQLGENPHFVLAFTREALAAAQLVHHNIAQIYDSGTDKGLHYFSMEFVDGEPLSVLVKREGRLGPEVAAGYVLQAARGLKFAHDRGMIHRDIKPENLLLNTDSIVKVADLGLVKVTELGAEEWRSAGGAGPELSDIIQEGTTMGTPAFMAPEQARDSRGVDLRADVYSLGCSLYNLVTGRPPFRGESAAEVIGKHFFEAPTPPEELAPRVPKSLSDIILLMMAKKPEQRLQDMGEVIAALEGFLGVDGTASFSPREEHAALLEQSVAEFNRARWARVRGYAGATFVGLSLGFVIDAIVLGAWGAAGLCAAFTGAAFATSAVIRSIRERGPLLLRLRQLALGAGLGVWAGALAALGLGIGTVAWAGALRSLAEMMGLGIAAALAFLLLVDRRAQQEQRPRVEAVEQMLKGMRLKGLEELKLRQFVCKYGGDDWENFYEQLFGYEAKLFARRRWGRDDRNQPRRRRGVWRDPLIAFLDRWVERRRHKRNARQLKKLEEADRKAEPPPPPVELG